MCIYIYICLFIHTHTYTYTCIHHLSIIALEHGGPADEVDGGRGSTRRLPDGVETQSEPRRTGFRLGSDWVRTDGVVAEEPRFPMINLRGNMWATCGQNCGNTRVLEANYRNVWGIRCGHGNTWQNVATCGNTRALNATYCKLRAAQDLRVRDEGARHDLGYYISCN